MVKNLSKEDLESIEDFSIERSKLLPFGAERRLYFINEIVEWQLTQYIWTGCTDVRLRDTIMAHASELIRQIIRKQNLHTIYPGQDESSFNDLLQTGWCQIERCLYKYRAKPHCRNCYNHDRPNDSSLYEPHMTEYGIITLEETIDKHSQCPKCGIRLYATPLVEPVQGLYAGSETILYKGMSKVFNMWCIAPESQLLGSQGIDSIKNVIDKQVPYVYGLNGFTKINGHLEKPEQDCLRIKTQYGYNIVSSPEHRFWTISDGKVGWKEAQHIKNDDLLAIQYDQQVFLNDDSLDIELQNEGEWNSPTHLTEELAYFIGLYIAGGWYSATQMAIRNIDHEVANRLVHNSLGIEIVYEPISRSVYFSNNRFKEFLTKIGLDVSAALESRSIPVMLMKCSKSNLSAMIRGLFDLCGNSNIKNGKVRYITHSKNLISQLRVLLLNFGIITKYSDKCVSKGGRSIKDLHRLHLSNYYSHRFYSDIGFTVSEKQSNYDKIKIDESEIHDGELRMYGLNDKFKSLYENHGASNLGYNSIKHLLSSNYCSLRTAISKLRLWSEHDNDPDFKFILDRINERQDIVNKLVWLPVKEVTNTRSRLCEISVESSCHSYIANGFVSHNSQVARTVILAHIKKEGRDKKNSNPYMSHLSHKHKPISGVMERLLSELREMNKYDSNHLTIINSLEHIINVDDKPHDGLIGKLVQHSNLSRQVVTNFLRVVKLRSFEMSDSLVNRTVEHKGDGRKHLNNDYEEE